MYLKIYIIIHVRDIHICRDHIRFLRVYANQMVKVLLYTEFPIKEATVFITKSNFLMRCLFHVRRLIGGDVHYRKYGISVDSTDRQLVMNY